MPGKFEQQPAPQAEKPEAKSKAEEKKEWKEYFGPMAESQEKQEFVERMAKGKEEKRLRGWKEQFGIMAELQEEMEGERAAVETAKTPKEGMRLEEILKEAGVEKPAESFKDFQTSLDEKIEGERTRKGEKISESDKLAIARKEYLKELGYSTKYKGLLLDKIEIRDENDKPINEFKSFYFSKTEKMVNDFLKEKLREKMEGKPAQELTDEEKLEAALRKAMKALENSQTNRGEKISFLQKVKTFGKEKWGKLTEGLARLNLSEKLGMGLRGGKKLAIEGGKDLMAIGLSPAVAIEEAGREVVGRIQAQGAVSEGMTAERIIELFEKMPADERPEYYGKALEGFRENSRRATGEMVKGLDKMYRKGKILSFLEKWGGRFGKGMGERLEPKAY